jgi:hypothetical protein
MTLSGEGLQLTAPRRGGSARDPRAKGQVRASLLKKIKLSDDWRAHAWIFEPLLAGIVFQEPHPATSAADLDVITLCSRSLAQILSLSWLDTCQR